MIGALLLGLIAGVIGRMLVPDMWSGLSGPKSWLFSLLLGLAGAALGYLIFTVGLGIGDTDVFDLGGIIGAILGVIILLPFVGIVRADVTGAQVVIETAPTSRRASGSA